MGSSVDRETTRPFLWNSSRGFLAYSKNKLLLLRGDMAMGIWARKYRYWSTGLWNRSREDNITCQTNELTFVTLVNKLCSFQKLHFVSETTDQPSWGWARVRCYQLSWRKPADGWWHRPPHSEAWTRTCSCPFAWKTDGKHVLLYGKAIPVMQQDRKNV